MPKILCDRFQNCYFFTKKNEDINGIDIHNELDKCNSIKDIFDLVKDCVKEATRESRAGLDIGLAELGNKPNALISAYYPFGSNIIVLNMTPLRRIMETKPDILKPYLFAILLHEYIHSLGYADEEAVREMSYAICRDIFGEGHPATRLSLDTKEFFPYLIYPGGHPTGNELRVIEVEDIDYIG